MRYYKITYEIGVNNERVYPRAVGGVVWRVTQDHHAENVMVGGTESQIEADGELVTELAEEEASALIEEFKKSYPEAPEENDLPWKRLVLAE